MGYHTNGSITAGGTAQNAIAEGHAFNSVVFQNVSDEDMTVAVGATAAAGTTGEVVYARTSATFTNLVGKRLSVVSATTGKKFVIREA